MSKRAIAGFSAAAIAAGLGFSAAQLAKAETTSPSPTPSATSSASPGTSESGQDSEKSGRRSGEGRSGSRGLDVTKLAEKLGVDETKVSSAVTAARDATRPTRDQSSSDETTQADRETDRSQRDAAFAKALAEELGLDESKVVTALEELRAERDAERSAADQQVLDQAVTDSKLTQAEADAVAKAIEQGIVRVRGTGR